MIQIQILLYVALGLLSLGAISQSAHAQASGGATSVSTGRYEAFMSAGYIGISSAASEFDVAPGFQVIPFPSFSWLQAGGEITYQKISYQSSSASNMLILGGITGNYGTTVNDAFFVSLGLAMRSGSGGSPSASSAATPADPNGFGFYFFAGKRFPIAGGFTLRPSMGVVSCGTTGMVFRPFAISYHF